MKYEIGIIKNTHGLKGEVVIKKTTDFERFTIDSKIYLIKDNKKIEFVIKSFREMKKGLVVLFAGYEDINLIEQYKGYSLYTDEEPHLDDDEYHYQEIIGLKVYNEEEKYVGVVDSIMEVPQGHILRIKNAEKVSLVPFNDYFIIAVNEVVVIKEIEGLL